jgi:hypothetical protein
MLNDCKECGPDLPCICKIVGIGGDAAPLHSPRAYLIQLFDAVRAFRVRGEMNGRMRMRVTSEFSFMPEMFDKMSLDHAKAVMRDKVLEMRYSALREYDEMLSRIEKL